MKWRIYMNVNDLDRYRVVAQVCKEKMKAKKVSKIFPITFFLAPRPLLPTFNSFRNRSSKM